MNGPCVRCDLPSNVTSRSCMTSSRTAWVFAGARLISSASTRFVKIRPGHQVGSELNSRKISVEAPSECTNQKRFRDPRHAFKENVSVSKQRHETPARSRRFGRSSMGRYLASWCIFRFYRARSDDEMNLHSPIQPSIVSILVCAEKRWIRGTNLQPAPESATIGTRDREPTREQTNHRMKRRAMLILVDTDPGQNVTSRLHLMARNAWV
jgi:hypothetical protein